MTKTTQPENPFVSIAINIVLPSVILSKGNAYLSPVWVLVIALLLPLTYGVWDYISRKHKNYVSLLGLVNTLVTGGLALMGAEGAWFAIKEASLPLLLGILVLGSSWTKKTAAEMLFCNPQVMNMEQINQALSERGQTLAYSQLLKQTSIWLSFSFFISALANFLLARFIFSPIALELESTVREQTLNEQIARMNWMGFIVIAGPLTVFSGVLVYRFLSRLANLTGKPITGLLTANK